MNLMDYAFGVKLIPRSKYVIRWGVHRARMRVVPGRISEYEQHSIPRIVARIRIGKPVERILGEIADQKPSNEW